MKKLLLPLGVCALCLFLVPATFAQGPVIKVIDVDTNAFARGGLTDGGSLTLSLSVDRIPSDTNCGTGVCGTLGAFVFYLLPRRSLSARPRFVRTSLHLGRT